MISLRFHHRILALPLLTALAFLLIYAMMNRATEEGSRIIERVQSEFFHALELSHGLQVDAMTIRHLLTNAVSSGNADDVDEAARFAGRVQVVLTDCQGVPLLAARLDSLSITFDEYWFLAHATTLDLMDAEHQLDVDFDTDLLDRVVLMNRRYDELRTLLDEVVAASNEALSEAMQDTRENIAGMRRRLNFISFVFITALLVMAVAAIGGIIRPVHRMSRVAQAIAGGDLHKELDYRSHDAFGELADSFRDMQAALVEDIERREEAEADLIAAQGQIIQSEKMAALGKMVAGLAHEMNSPLGTLISAADTLDRGRRLVGEKCATAGDLEELRRDPRFAKGLRALEQGVGNLTVASERVDELVSGLRAFSLLDQAEYQQMDINEGVAATLTVVDHEVPDEVEIVALAGDVPPILGYPAQLNQMLLAVVRHALGEVTPPSRIEVATAVVGGRVHITVSHDQRLHDAAALAGLFDPGFRSDRDRVRMNWGLVACAAVARRHGGVIRAESGVGRGTIYRVELPADATGARA
ncbi:MAG: HAMP domain-containing protein [bacterium]|nr:HAMP domain-containing protein [bacterium]